MSGLALILSKQGYSVSGSDKKGKESLKDLQFNGVKIFTEQKPSNITKLSEIKKEKILIVKSSAIPDENPELIAAIEKKYEIWHRSQVLAELMKEKDSIVISGSHGKTTTSTIISSLLTFAKKDPTAIIGGQVPLFQSNAHFGKGNLLVAEADESDGSLINFQGKIGLITNLELDHTDHYSNIDELIKTMKLFSKKFEKMVLNYDCKLLRENFKAYSWWSTSTNKDVDFSAIPKEFKGNATIANYYEKGNFLGELSVPLTGSHNLSNILGAIAICRLEGISFDIIKENLKKIKAPKRRFEIRGIWEERIIVDDYAHHPSEIKATISMAKLMLNKNINSLPKKAKRLVVIFQPHRYSRTKTFLNEFAIALAKADKVIITPIYGSGEKPIKEVNNYKLASRINKMNCGIEILALDNYKNFKEILKEQTNVHDLIILMGAGDINKIWENLNSNDNKNQSIAA